MTKEEKIRLSMILELRENINTSLWAIDDLLANYFPQEHISAKQHWIPQIATALYNDTKWLPRGQVTLQDNIDHINDTTDLSSGVTKYIGDKNGH